MAKEELSDEARVKAFMEAFHHTSNRREWVDMRGLMRVDILARVTFGWNEASGKVFLQANELPYKEAMFAGPLFRKYISTVEPVYLPKVIEAVRSLGITGEIVDEAHSQVTRTISNRFEFIVDPESGASVGMSMDILPGPIRWDDATDLDDPKLTTLKASTRDATEVLFNEGALHAFKRDKNETQRAAIRSAPQVYQDFLAHIAIAATVYAAGTLHMALNDSGDPRWKCASFCQERVILEALRRGRSTE